MDSITNLQNDEVEVTVTDSYSGCTHKFYFTRNHRSNACLYNLALEQLNQILAEEEYWDHFDLDALQ